MNSFGVVKDGEIIRMLITLISNDAIDVTSDIIVIISLSIMVPTFCFKKSSLPLVRKQERKSYLRLWQRLHSSYAGVSSTQRSSVTGGCSMITSTVSVW